MDFDSRATVLLQDIDEHWAENAKQQWLQNKDIVREQILHQYGVFGHGQKLKNFIDLGSKPFSVLAFHNTFLANCREAFTIGAYYPALTGTCALGERILNHLILLLREDYKDTPEYKQVYRKHSFDNWKLATNTLLAWNVLLPDVGDSFFKT